jgi:superfamily I DNA/RNA helicase
MKGRISGLLQGVEEARVWVATFHGFCLDVLRSEVTGPVTGGFSTGFALCSEVDALTLAKEVLVESKAGSGYLKKFLTYLMLKFLQ